MEHRGELDPETGYREDATVVDCMNCGTLTCDEVDELLMKENEREYRTDAA
jgi:hypothetical protein